MNDPEDFRRLAAKMLQRTCSPAETRTAISRSYYAMFLIVRGLLSPHFRFSNAGKVHEEVYQILINCGDATAVDVGNKLKDLRDLRNDADYDMIAQQVESVNTARLWENVAAKQIKTIVGLLGGARGAAVLAGMKAWAKLSGVVPVRP